MHLDIYQDNLEILETRDIISKDNANSQAISSVAIEFEAAYYANLT